jgi:hypothetical protein
MIAYGLHIGTRVEMSTLGETNNAQFFSEPESSAFYCDSNCGICKPPIILSSYPLVYQFAASTPRLLALVQSMRSSLYCFS